MNEYQRLKIKGQLKTWVYVLTLFKSAKHNMNNININTDWEYYLPAPHQSWKLKNPVVLVRTYRKIKKY